jgi:hypothetical protein
VRHPLIRAGEGPADAYHRIRRELQVEAAKIARILRDTASPEPERPSRGTAPGDERKLRGIPVQARGVGGTIPGSDPVSALLDNDRRGR